MPNIAAKLRSAPPEITVRPILRDHVVRLGFPPRHRIDLSLNFLELGKKPVNLRGFVFGQIPAGSSGCVFEVDNLVIDFHQAGFQFFSSHFSHTT